MGSQPRSRWPKDELFGKVGSSFRHPRALVNGQRVTESASDKVQRLFQEQKKFLTELAAYTSFCTGKGILMNVAGSDTCKDLATQVDGS
jgi:hypothetical protein